MAELLVRVALLLEGAWDLLGERLAEARWSLAPGGAAVLLVGSVAVAVLAVLCYARTREGLTPRARVGLGLLRAAGLLALLIMLSGAVCEVSVAASRKPLLLAVIDDSASMNLPEAGPDRRARVEQALNEGGLLARLEADFEVRKVYTSGDANPPASTADAPPQDLARNLVLAANTGHGRPIAHLLLCSDGVQTDGSDLARAAGELPAPVSTLFTGEALLRDLALGPLTVPPFVYRKDRVRVAAEVLSDGMEGEATVRLYHEDAAGEKELSVLQVQLDPSQSVVARMEFIAPEAGTHHYRIRIDPQPIEHTARNNEARFNLDVRAERIRVLFVEGEPSWEYKHAKQALEGDPAIHFHGLVRQPGNEWIYYGDAVRPDGKPVLREVRGGFPGTADELQYFDVLVMGDLERKLLEQGERFVLLDEFVRRQGGGLATLGGYKVYTAGDYQETPLARMLPVRLSKEKKLQLINRFNVDVSTQGLMHPLMQLEFDPLENQKVWAKLPWVEGGNAWKSIKPGATLLMSHPTLHTASGPRPVAAAWRYGAGRVYSTALDGTWHWRTARETEQDYHRRYWGLLVRWLAGDPRQRSTRSNLLIDDPVLEAGRMATVSLHLRDATGQAPTDARVDFFVEGPDGPLLTTRAAAEPDAPGRFALRFVPPAAGHYTVKTNVTVGSEQQPALERTYVVGPSLAEVRRVSGDAEALHALAQACGGQALNLEDHALLEIPKASGSVEVRGAVVELWHAPGLWLLMAGCLGLEWLMRKRRGLA
ncbi:MAG: hypothetical protein AMXMBFR7_22270 [Planctomycetota bacterium]